MESGVKGVYFDLPIATVEELHRLRGVCGVPLNGLIRLAIDLLTKAHDAEAKGGKLTIVGPTGKAEVELRLPNTSLDIRTIPLPQLDNQEG